MQAEAQIEAQKMQLEAQLQAQLAAMKHEFNKEIETIRATATLGFKETDEEFKEKLEVLNPDIDTKPRVFYKNLHRYNKCFIGGSVAIIESKTIKSESGNISLRFFPASTFIEAPFSLKTRSARFFIVRRTDSLTSTKESTPP